LDLSFVKLIFKKNECNQILQVNEFVKRARAAKIHAYIMGHLKKEMPTMMGKAKAQQRLIDNLEDEFAKVSADNLIAWLLLSGR
jgi:EH domain-containing protein 1